MSVFHMLVMIGKVLSIRYMRLPLTSCSQHPVNCVKLDAGNSYRGNVTMAQMSMARTAQTPFVYVFEGLEHTVWTQVQQLLAQSTTCSFALPS